MWLSLSSYQRNSLNAHGPIPTMPQYQLLFDCVTKILESNLQGGVFHLQFLPIMVEKAQQNSQLLPWWNTQLRLSSHWVRMHRKGIYRFLLAVFFPPFHCIWDFSSFGVQFPPQFSGNTLIYLLKVMSCLNISQVIPKSSQVDHKG